MHSTLIIGHPGNSFSQPGSVVFFGYTNGIKAIIDQSPFHLNSVVRGVEAHGYVKRNLGIQPREPQPALRFLNGLAGGDEAPASELDGAMKTLLTWIVLPAALPGCRTLAELASAYFWDDMPTLYRAKDALVAHLTRDGSPLALQIAAAVAARFDLAPGLKAPRQGVS